MYSIVLPVLNEVENLKILLPQLLNPDCQVIVADNGSTDGSVRLVMDAMSSFNIKLCPGTGTVGDAVLRGLHSVTTDRVLVMDADSSHPFNVVHEIVKLLDDFDIVVGSRYTQFSVTKDTELNQFLSELGNFLAWGLAPRLSDRMSGMFGIRKSLLDTKGIRPTAKPMLEFLVHSRTTSYTEVPIDFEKRTIGKSKLGRSPVLMFKSVWDLILLYIFKFQKPFKFVIVGGVGMILQLLFLKLFTDKFHLYYILSSFFAILIVTVWNYVLNNYWTFKQKGVL